MVPRKYIRMHVVRNRMGSILIENSSLPFANLKVVGIMLLSEGGHLAHLHILGNEVTPMSKTTFYFVITTLVLVDTVQSIYQKNLRRKS